MASTKRRRASLVSLNDDGPDSPLIFTDDDLIPRNASSRKTPKTPKWFTVKVAVFAFSFVNFLNYVDRGIIAGAGTTIKGCVWDPADCTHAIEPKPCSNTTTREDCISCPVCNTTCGGKLIQQTGFGINTQQLGYLQSAFMVGYSVACLVIAQLVHVIPPFKIIGVSLLVWTFAVVLSGLPNILCDKTQEGLCPYFWLMLFGRIMSGIGEAAIGTTAVPYLDDRCPANRKGLYLAIYFMTLPFGTAVGFMWGGAITSATDEQWQWAFFGEAPFMLPFAILAFFIPDRIGQSSRGAGSVNSGDEAEALLEPGASPAAAAHEGPAVPTAWAQIKGCCSSPIFMSVCLGYAVYSGVVAGLGFYGPLYIQTNRPCDARWNFKQSDADFVFGSVIAATGFFGTAAGGILLDRMNGSDANANSEGQGIRRIINPAWACLWECTLGSALLVTAAFIESPEAFFATLALGCFFIFMCTAGVNLVIAWSVPSQYRPMGLALSIIMLHGFGDVPSPVIIGRLADTTTPAYTLRVTLACLSVAVLLWLATYTLSKRAVLRLPIVKYSPRLGADPDNNYE